MTRHEQRATSVEARHFRRTLTKCGVFAALSALIGVYLIGTIQGQTGGRTDTYHADFTDVSGLVSGDPVKVSGVTVGRVSDVEVVDATHIRVTFTANRDQTLTDATNAQVRYANLLGQRFLGLTQKGRPGRPLEHGGTIPASRTAPAVSLTALLNGFRPLFESLDADQVSELLNDVVQMLQGETGRIDRIIARTASLTTYTARRSGLLTRVVDSLTTLVRTVSRHDEEFAQSLVSLRNLTRYLAHDSGNIARTIDSVDHLTRSVDGLLGNARAAGLDDLIGHLDELTGTLDANAGRLRETVRAFPRTFAALDRITQSGTWANGYPCSASVKTVGLPQVSLRDVASAVGIFTGLGPTTALTLLLTGLGVGSTSVKVPIDVPQGPIGDPNSHSEACR